MDNLDDKLREQIQSLVKTEVINEVEVVEDAPEEIVEGTSKTIVSQLHNAAVIKTVKENKNIKKKFVGQAKRSVHAELGTIDQEIKKRQQTATYNANEEACKNYGIDKDVPLWQITMMKIGSGFWFVIYWLFATFTIAPLNIFFKGISSFIKNSYFVFVLALICYLAIIIGIPILIKIFG